MQATGEVPVAARPLPRGHLLQTQDLAGHTSEPSDLNGQCLLDAGAAVGQLMRQAVRAGERLRATLLEAPVLVHRGAPVAIELRGASFAVRAAGRVLASGSAGARVAAENPASKRVVHGTVTAPGRVTVGF